ncbi:hypothetical protein [Pedobacter heparinus]|uniref:hypothetical protein n=1 Tax=Pedobacter heparinus TaxID=984 RepID=UPI002931D1F3|nr:hypothetical protein [Pedobacter heparinus]
MKIILFSILLVISFGNVHAQQDYKAVLDSFYQHSRSDFKEIMAKQIDTGSVFYPSKATPDVGNVKIGKYPNAVTLNWIVPLTQSAKVQAATQDFIKTTYSDAKLYKTVSEGTEEEGDMTTNVYVLGGAKPLLIFQTIYYRNEDADKSNFTIIMYGK